jgi:bacterioferritin-associated ferredoxin
MSRFIRNAIDNHSHLGLNIIQAQWDQEIMYVCICNAITDKQIRQAAESGVEDFWELQRTLGVAAGCGSCKEMASAILSEGRLARARFEPVRYQPAAV